MHLRYPPLFLGAVALLFVVGSVRAVEYVGGELIKIQSSDAVYYVGTDLKRYVFSNERIYKTWYQNFDKVQAVTSEELNSVPLAGVVTYRPGTRMVKIPDDPKVYAIGKNGLARHITTEDVATVLYGTDWIKKVDDLPASLFLGVYTIGDPITLTTQFDPASARDAETSISGDRGLPVLVTSSPDAPPAPTSTPPAVPAAPTSTPAVLGAVEDMEIARSDSNIMYVASLDGGVGVWKTKDGGKTWSRIRTGGAVETIAVHGTNPDVVLLSDGGKIYRTTNGGAVWSSITVSSTVGPVQGLAFATGNPEIVYGLSSRWLIKSTNGGATWSNISSAENLTFAFTDALLVHPLDNDTVFAGSTQGVQRSTDGGVSWTQLKPPTGTEAVRVRSIDSHPRDPLVYYITTDQGLWYTADNGSSWNPTRVPDVANDELYDLDLADSDTNIVYVATKKGVFRSTDRARSWEAVNGNLPLADVKALAVDAKDEKRVIVGTRDQGVTVVDGEGVYFTSEGGLKWEKQQATVPN